MQFPPRWASLDTRTMKRADQVLRCHGAGLGLGRHACIERAGKHGRQSEVSSRRIRASGMPIVFEPLTGKVAWPHLTPHFGRRVPFSPNHVGAPWLEMIRREANG
jgi:hypothetical protein